MTKDRFKELLNTVTVRDAPAGIYIQGMTREELAEIVTMAGREVGEVTNGACFNPEWLATGPLGNMENV